MSNNNRYRHRDRDEIDRSEVLAAVDTTTVIEVGDLVWQGWGFVRVENGIALYGKAKAAFPASAMEMTVTVCKQEWFATNFLGVAMQGSSSGDDYPIREIVRVATTGVFEFDCPSGTFELGDLISVDLLEYPLYERLANQQVVKATSLRLAIGRVAKFEHKISTTVLVDIQSQVMKR